MKKAMVMLMVVFLAGALLIAAGCGSKVTVTGEDGSFEIDQRTGEIKIHTDEGDATVSMSDVTADDIGVPFYPGAKTAKDGFTGYTTTTTTGQDTYSGVVLYTDDPIGKVIEWYRGALSGKSEFTDLSAVAGGEQVGMFMFTEGGSMKNVAVAEGDSSDPGKTMIHISSASGPDFAPTR